MSGRKGKVMGGKVEATAALDYAGLPLATLSAKMRRVLDAGVHGLCFSAYLDGQGPEQQSQLSPCQLSTPSRPAMPAMTSAATGSAHHQPVRAFASSPTSSAADM